jgi:polyisoprenoid-binding protein YceI
MQDYSLLSYQRKLVSRFSKMWIPAFAGMTIFIAASASHAADWKIIPEQSTIEFTAKYGKDAIIGNFTQFDGTISFDSKAPEKSRVMIEVQMNHIKSDDKDAVTYLPMAEWFAAKEFPTSVFMVENIRKVSDTEFLADGSLKMRDKTMPVSLPFTLDIKDGDNGDTGKQFARMNGTATLKRLDFGIGQGEWAATDVIANEVDLKIHLEAVSQ